MTQGVHVFGSASMGALRGPSTRADRIHRRSLGPSSSASRSSSAKASRSKRAQVRDHVLEGAQRRGSRRQRHAGQAPLR
jgi:hypothetical protein